MTGPKIAKIDEYKRKRIVKLHSEGVAHKDIAKSLGISIAAVHRLAKGVK